MNPELIKKIKESPYYSELQEYILANITELNTIDGFVDMSNERVGEEVKARKLAFHKLIDILKPFIDYRDPQEPTKEMVQYAKDKFGIV